MGRLVHDHHAEFGLSLAAVIAPERPSWLDSSLHRERLADAPPADLVIDFTHADGVAAVAAWCTRRGTPLVSGTTGLGPEQERALDAAATVAPVLHAANFSPGVNALLRLAAEAAQLLGPEVRAEITDVHHVHKKDSPSGTALALRDALGDVPCAIESRREGEVVGDHELRFELAGETLTLAHHARDRAIFARGALRAGRWLLGQAPGRYTAPDWLGGEKT
jgi:4-hydroxy-tetrahydrodipicolinate reductase